MEYSIENRLAGLCCRSIVMLIRFPGFDTLPTNLNLLTNLLRNFHEWTPSYAIETVSFTGIIPVKRTDNPLDYDDSLREGILSRITFLKKFNRVCASKIQESMSVDGKNVLLTLCRERYLGNSSTFKTALSRKVRTVLFKFERLDDCVDHGCLEISCWRERQPEQIHSTFSMEIENSPQRFDELDSSRSDEDEAEEEERKVNLIEERRNLDQEKAVFEQERRQLEQERIDFYQSLNVFYQEKGRFEQEKRQLEQEKIDFSESLNVFYQEKDRFKEEEQQFEKERINFSQDINHLFQEVELLAQEIIPSDQEKPWGAQKNHKIIEETKEDAFIKQDKVGSTHSVHQNYMTIESEGKSNSSTFYLRALCSSIKKMKFQKEAQERQERPGGEAKQVNGRTQKQLEKHNALAKASNNRLLSYAPDDPKNVDFKNLIMKSSQEKEKTSGDKPPFRI